MDDLRLIRDFRRQARVPDTAKDRARQLLEHRLESGGRQTRHRRPARMQTRTLVALTGGAVLAACVAAAGLIAFRDPGGRPQAVTPSGPAPVAAGQASALAASPSSGSTGAYRQYLRFAKRLDRIQVAIGPRLGGVRERDADRPVCSSDQLADIERNALLTLGRGGLPRGQQLAPGVAFDVMAAVGDSEPCRYGSLFGTGRAQSVYEGRLPLTDLMPQAQLALATPGKQPLL